MAKRETGQLRQLLIAAAEKAMEGNLSKEEGDLLIGLARQINNNMNAETEHRKNQARLQQQLTPYGRLVIGETDQQ